MADEGASHEEAQLTFNVKSSSDAKYVMTVPSSMTVGDLKNKLSTAEYADLPASRQRLIYSGRVLKDQDTLASYKIKDGNTVHLVKGAESNNRQNPANQGGSTPVPTSNANPASNVPSNIAAGQGANNPLAALTGARYAGFHGLPGMDTFGADGGMGAPPDPEQMLRLLENPNFAQQMNEAMNNPAVLDMMRQSPMMRDNPMLQHVLNNPEMRRMMFDPQFIRMQMNLQRQMGGTGFGGVGGGAQNFPAPGVTDTTQGGQQNQGQEGQRGQQPQNPFGMFGGMGGPNASGANPFAALFGGNPGAAQGTTPAVTPPATSAGQTPAQGTTPAVGTADGQQPQNPFASLLGGGGGGGGQGGSNPMADMTRQMMQNPDMMRNMMQMMGMGGQGEQGGPTEGGGQQNPFAGFNPAMFGGFGGQQQPQQPADNRPPEERYSEQLQQLNDMGFYEFERNVRALRMSGGSVQGAVEHLLSGV